MNPTVKAAFFDFDGTLIHGDSIVSLLTEAVCRGLISPFYLIKFAFLYLVPFRLGLLSSEKLKTRSLAPLYRIEKEKRDAFFSSFARGLFHRIYPDGLAMWNKMKAGGYTMVIVTASTYDYMQYVAASLGADILVATNVSGDGRVYNNCRGSAKASRIRELNVPFDYENSFAFGNSGGDIPMLSLIGHPCAVNPDRKLKKECKIHRWDTVIWKTKHNNKK